MDDGCNEYYYGRADMVPYIYTTYYVLCVRYEKASGKVIVSTADEY